MRGPRALVHGALALAVLALVLASAGCITRVLGRSAGGERIWWCDRCGERVASPETHVCGMTVYDPATDQDVPRKGVTPEELAQAREERALDTTSPANEPARGGPWWRFWRSD